MYKIFIDSVDNSWYSLIPFMGVQVSSKKDIVDALKKYGTYQKEDKKYWRNLIKITFLRDTTIIDVKNNGDEQASNNGIIDLFKLSAVTKKDNLNKYTIYFRKGSWVDNNGNIFSWIVDDGKDTKPFQKLSDVLNFLNIKF